MFTYAIHPTSVSSIKYDTAYPGLLFAKYTAETSHNRAWTGRTECHHVHPVEDSTAWRRWRVTYKYKRPNPIVEHMILDTRASVWNSNSANANRNRRHRKNNGIYIHAILCKSHTTQSRRCVRSIMVSRWCSMFQTHRQVLQVHSAWFQDHMFVSIPLWTESYIDHDCCVQQNLLRNHRTIRQCTGDLVEDVQQSHTRTDSQMSMFCCSTYTEVGQTNTGWSETHLILQFCLVILWIVDFWCLLWYRCNP